MNRKQAFLDKDRLARTRRGIDPLAWIRRVGPLTSQPLPEDLSRLPE